jgi:hypothetical protein
MKKIILSFIFAATCVYAQLGQPSLDQIKIAADAGDPASQDKLAENFIMHMDMARAETWYRKAAEQGYAHAEGKLGDMLLMHYRTGFSVKPDVRGAVGDEALKWITNAANQGDKQGQADLAGLCLEGTLVKRDLIEAYKWGDLAAQGSGISIAFISGQSVRNSAILKMDADQIGEAKRRVAAFVPHQPNKSEQPEPAWVQKIKLNGISGAPPNRLAVIGSHTFQEGDGGNLKIEGKSVAIKCLIISDSSATILIAGINGTRTLVLN